MKALLVLATFLFLAAPALAATTHSVGIRNSRFDPAAVVAASGDTVRWTNNDPFSHTVTALDGSFDSGVLGPGQIFSHTFGGPGAAAYRCALHLSMWGAVVVAP